MSLVNDSREASAALSEMDLDADVFSAISSLMEEGIVVLRGSVSGQLCDSAVNDYINWSEQNLSYVGENLDELGRPKRLVNFHMHSENALAICSNDSAHRILDVLFGSKSSVYTSLTFKFGTQQGTHRDTPHFATWPELQFAGVWTALEDIHPDSGALFYHKGAHKMEIPHRSIFFQQANDRIPTAPLSERLAMALDLYNGEVDRMAHEFAEPTSLEVNKGDVVIWHPNMPHGGSVANNPMLTRWSIVCHCAPEGVQVHQHEAFFQHSDSNPPPARYGFAEGRDRKIALAGDVAFM